MIDIFDIMGPIMVGPSSSHTAGAVRIGRMARTLLGDEPVKAAVHLHGSFAETGVGHGTNKALIAGLLGLAPDDLDIPNSFELAAEQGLAFTIDEADLRDAHPNSVQMELVGRGTDASPSRPAPPAGAASWSTGWTAWMSASPATTTPSSYRTWTTRAIWPT